MSCNCNRERYINRNGQVMGEFGIPRIELRGPGCINGTGRCNVRGASGRCTNVFGTGDDLDKFDNDVLGTSGRRNCYNDDVLGTGGRRRNCDNVMGTGGRNRGRNCCCEWIWSYLETPTIVPR